AADKLETVPNLTEDLHGHSTTLRPRGRGAMIARLVPEKRVEDAITAIAHVRAETPEVTLDVYGEGEDRSRLTDIMTEVDVMDAVRSHRHTTAAKSNYHTGSFSLLASRFDLDPPVVLARVSAGRTPICHDGVYGPDDIVADGVKLF